MPVDRAAELALDEGADDLRAQTATDLPLGEADAGVAHADLEHLAVALRGDLNVALLTGEQVVPAAWTGVVLLALASQIVGQGCLVYALGEIPPLIVGLTLLTQPAVSALVGWLAYDERLTPLDVVGALAIAAALVLVRLRPRGPEPS